MQSPCFRSASAIEFLYKPLYSALPYPESAELDEFAYEREQELSRAGVSDLYQQFWLQYPILSGTIYGAMPTHLLNEEQDAELVRLGWKRCSADVIFFRRGLSRKEIQRIAETEFERYLLVDTTEYTPTMLFHFHG